MNAIRQIGVKMWEHFVAGLQAAWGWCVETFDSAIGPVMGLVPDSAPDYVFQYVNGLGCYWWLFAGDYFILALAGCFQMLTVALVVAWVRMRFIGGM